MVAVKRKRADTVQGPLKKLYTAENETDEKKSESAVSEDGQGEPNAVSSEQKNTSNKLPTAGELRAINEAANLYRSNAFKAQLDLLLPNVRAKDIHTAVLERLLEKLYGHLTSIPSISPVHPLDVTEALSSLATSKTDPSKDTQKRKQKERNVTRNHVDVVVPYPDPLPTRSTAWKVSFEAPAPKGIIVVGSWQDGMAVRRPDGAPFCVDLMVEMPDGLFQEKDYRNARVFHKRAFYLACLAASLAVCPDFEDTWNIQYESPEGDQRRTVLVLTPKTDDTVHLSTCIRIIPTISDTTSIPLQRLSPSQANLRFASSLDSADVPSLIPSPTYNSTVALTLSRTARTHLFNAHRLSNEVPALRDALALLRVWANQRGYGAGSRFSVDGKSSYPMAGYCVRGFEGLGVWWGCVLEVLVSGEELQGEKAKRSGAGRPLVGRGLSSYQLFRAALDFLSKRDFVKEPVFMKVSSGGVKFDISEWTLASRTAMSATSFNIDEPYPVPVPVFIDSTGCVNMLGGVPAEALELLRLDALSTLSLLNKLNKAQSQDDTFDRIFLQDAREPSARFDAVIKVDLPYRHVPLQSLILSDLPNLQAHTLISLLHTLRRALNTRIKAVVALQPRSLTRPVSEAHPKNHATATIGLIYNETVAGRLVDLGPAIQEEDEEILQQPNQGGSPLHLCPQTDLDIPSNPFPSRNAFRSFWGPKSELRRFKDGRILESCVWDEGIVRAEDREGIVPMIVRYIIGYRFRKGEGGVGAMRVVGGDLGEVVVVREEQRQGSFKDALGKFETLVRAIKALEDEEDADMGGKYLPLSVLSCRPGENAAGLRYMDVVPPTAAVSGTPSDELGSTAEPFGVVLQLERSGMWPSDVRAVQRVKMALLESMARGLRGIKARVGKEDVNITADIIIEGGGSVGDSATLEVTLDGWSFRVRIAHDREVLLLEEVIKPSKQVQVLKQQLGNNTAQDITFLQAQQALTACQTRFDHAPAHHTAFLAFHHRIPAFGYTVRLVKRWFGAHWLSGRVREEAVELICAAVFLADGSEGASRIATGKRGFIKVLEWLSRWQGVTYVGVFEAVQDESVGAIQPGEDTIHIEVKAGKGSWRLVTKEDKEGTVWCGDVGPVIATRVRDLALASVDVVKSNFLESFKPLFHHPKEDYDFLIELDKRVVTRYWQSLSASKAALPSTTKPNLLARPAASSDTHTRVGFNPAEAYFRELQRIYGDVAELFYDTYGGTVIGGVWNPLVVGKEHTWRVMLGFSTVPESGKLRKTMTGKGKDNAKVDVRFNKDGVFAEMKRMGEGMVVSIVEG